MKKILLLGFFFIYYASLQAKDIKEVINNSTINTTIKFSVLNWESNDIMEVFLFVPAKNSVTIDCNLEETKTTYKVTKRAKGTPLWYFCQWIYGNPFSKEKFGKKFISVIHVHPTPNRYSINKCADIIQTKLNEIYREISIDVATFFTSIVIENNPNFDKKATDQQETPIKITIQ